MVKAAKLYVHYVDSLSLLIGNVVKYLVLVMIGLLAYETISRYFFNNPHKWALEMTQFINGTYYMLGGCYALLMGGHARMDFFYEKWSPRKKALFDTITFTLTLAFMVILLIGGYRSSLTSIKFAQKSYSAWGPPIAPIKIICVTGIFLMLLQNTSELIKDAFVLTGKDTSWIKVLERK